MHSQIIYPMGNKSTGSEDVTYQHALFVNNSNQGYGISSQQVS